MILKIYIVNNCGRREIVLFLMSRMREFFTWRVSNCIYVYLLIEIKKKYSILSVY